MSKETASTAPDRAVGPFLQAALFCDDVLQEVGGRNTLLRVVTDIKVEASGPGAPQAMPMFPMNLTLYLVFNAGERPGTYDVQIDIVTPGGEVRSGPANQVDLKHDFFTSNFIVKMTAPMNSAGVYWFVIRLAGRESIRLPLTVHYASLSDSSTPPAPPSAEPPQTPPTPRSTH